MAPRISVVIPTYKRPDLLARCLSAVLRQDLEREAYEVIVVDDGRDESTRRVVEAMAAERDAPDLRYTVPNGTRGPAGARNAGWRCARGALIAFTDDDTVPEPDWLAEGERAVQRRIAVCGRVIVPPLSEPPTDHELMTRGLESAEFVTANAFVWRDAMERVGGFDERFTRAWREDSDLQFRLSRLGEVARIEDAAVLHPVRPERWGVCLRQQRNTFFDALLYKKHPQLYRERIRRVPPWNYYLVVVLVPAAVVLAGAGERARALAALGIAALLILQLAWKRLKKTSHKPAHIAEMLATSAVIPFLSVYWRLRGAWRWRVLFL
jgi:glycosyltransferase involved in cell wall biosynthesis